MGLLDKFKQKSKQILDINENADTYGQVTLGKMTSEAAKKIMTDLSGGETVQKGKLIDNVLLFMNASGGTGVTTIVQNVASVCRDKNLRTLVIDLHLLYPLQDSIFGVEPMMERPDLTGYLLGKNELKKAIINNGNFSILFSNNRTLMDSINCEEDTPIQNYMNMLNTLRKMYDVILIDCPNDIDHTLINTAMYSCDHIYMVWDEGLPSILNTEKVRRALAQTGVDSYTKLSVILNKRTNVTYGDYPFKRLNIELDQILPFDPSVVECQLKNQVFVEKASSRSDNASIFYNGIYELTDKILDRGGSIA